MENNDFVSLWLLLLYYYLYCFSKIIVQNKRYSIWAHLFTTTLLHRTLSSKNDSHKEWACTSHIYNDTEKWDSYFMILFPYISVFFLFLCSFSALQSKIKLVSLFLLLCLFIIYFSGLFFNSFSFLYRYNMNFFNNLPNMLTSEHSNVIKVITIIMPVKLIALVIMLKQLWYTKIKIRKFVL